MLHNMTWAKIVYAFRELFLKTQLNALNRTKYWNNVIRLVFFSNFVETNSIKVCFFRNFHALIISFFGQTSFGLHVKIKITALQKPKKIKGFRTFQRINKLSLLTAVSSAVDDKVLII